MNITGSSLIDLSETFPSSLISEISGWLCCLYLSLQFKVSIPKSTPKKMLHPGKLTCSLKNWWLEDKPFLLKWPLFRAHSFVFRDANHQQSINIHQPFRPRLKFHPFTHHLLFPIGSNEFCWKVASTKINVLQLSSFDVWNTWIHVDITLHFSQVHYIVQKPEETSNVSQRTTMKIFHTVLQSV